MKRITLFLCLCLSTSLFAQPFFHLSESSNNPSYTYGLPYDAHYDGTTRAYSYHSANNGGMIVTKYSTATGFPTNAVYFSSTAAAFTPVRVKTEGGYFYTLFNFTLGGVSRYGLAKVDAVTNAVNFVYYFSSVTGGAATGTQAVDFVLDGAGKAYVLSNVQSTVASGFLDIAITCINVGTPTPTVAWHNNYPEVAAPSRNEKGSNIILHNNKLFVSGTSWIPAAPNDIRVLIMRADLVAGTHEMSRLYTYFGNCGSIYTINRSWVMSNGANLTLMGASTLNTNNQSSMWIANVSPASLLTLAPIGHYQATGVSLNPEIQLVTPSSGNLILVSGSRNATSPPNTDGYLHYYFNPSTMAYVQGTFYNTLNPSAGSTRIFDTYVAAASPSLFTMAENNTATTYDWLKASATGATGCSADEPLQSITCILESTDSILSDVHPQYQWAPFSPFTQVAVKNLNTQTCLVSMLAPQQPSAVQEKELGNFSGNVSVYPNPVKDVLMLDARGQSIETIGVYALTGMQIQLPVKQSAGGVEIDFSAVQQGFYIVRATINGEQQAWRIFRL